MSSTADSSSAGIQLLPSAPSTPSTAASSVPVPSAGATSYGAIGATAESARFSELQAHVDTEVTASAPQLPPGIVEAIAGYDIHLCMHALFPYAFISHSSLLLMASISFASVTLSFV